MTAADKTAINICENCSQEELIMSNQNNQNQNQQNQSNQNQQNQSNQSNQNKR